MRKVPLILAILLFLGSGFVFLRAFENYTAAAGWQKLADEWGEKMKNTQDMAELEKIKDAIDTDFLPELREAKQAGMMGMGGGVVLLAGSIVLFIKSRRPKAAA